MLFIGLLTTLCHCSFGQGAVGLEPYSCNDRLLPHLEIVPPLSSDMPIEVMQAYIVMDSIAKRGYTYDEVASILNSLSDSDIVSINKYIYHVKDNNPLNFVSYLYWSEAVNSEYRGSIYTLIAKYYQFLTQKRGYNKLDMLLAFSDVLVEGEIVEIDSTELSNAPWPEAWGMNYVVCVEAKVNNVIKGGGAIEACYDINEQPQSCIRFKYHKFSVTEYDEFNKPGVSSPILSIDSIGTSPDGSVVYGHRLSSGTPWFGIVHQPHVGDRFIAALSVAPTVVNTSESTMYTMLPLSGFSIDGGIFMVKNGWVIDRGNIFGLGEEVPLDAFYSWLINYLQNHFQN